MTTFYHGADGLIQVQGDAINVAMSRLATLNRSYACRVGYTEKARSILQVGYRPSDYPFMGLAVKPTESSNGIITTFNCTFNGALYFSDFNVPYITISAEQKTIKINGFNKVQYLAPVETRQYIAPIGSDITPSIPSGPDLLKSSPIFSDIKQIWLGTYIFQGNSPTTIAIEPKVQRTYYRRVNFGVVDQIDVQFSLYTEYDA